jgi:thymidylate kinase
MLVKPYLTIILMGKARGICDEDVYEKDTALQKLVRVGYSDHADKNQSDCCIIDCEDTVAAVHWNVIEELLFADILQKDG